MSSGVKMDDDCQTIYNDMKMSKKYRYIIYKISDDNKKIIVHTTGERDATYDSFLAYLNAEFPKDCCYAVFDLEKEDKKAKIFILSWNPDNAPIKTKMVFASSKDCIKKTLKLETEVQATDFEEASYAEVKQKVFKNEIK